MIFGNRNQGSGGGFNIRLLIGAAIVLFGVVTYFSRTQVNPVTGEKQRIAMSVDQERALGLQSAPEMANQMGGAIDARTDRDARRVAELGAKLVSSSDASKSPYADNFHFYLLDDSQTVNAFALPGGQIFITRALYSRLQTDDQLAGVLGHEIGHVIHRHAAEHMAKSQLGQSITGGVAIGTSDRNNGQLATMAAAMASQMIQLKYGRGDELQSDEWGIRVLEQAGYDPHAMLDVMEILKQAAGSGGRSNMFSTHPDPDARIARIKEILAKK